MFWACVILAIVSVWKSFLCEVFVDKVCTFVYLNICVFVRLSS